MSEGRFCADDATCFSPSELASILDHPTIEDLQKPVIMDAMIDRVRRDGRRNCQHQVDALLAAGWRFEVPHENATEPWQWYWRSPPKRKGSNGRFWWSTNQAYNGLMRGMKP